MIIDQINGVFVSPELAFRPKKSGSVFSGISYVLVLFFTK